VLAATAVAAPSGDSCAYTSTSSGTAYTVNVVTGAGVQQYGFAFGAPGLTIQNISIAGKNGNFTTANLPPNTSGAFASDAATTGTVSATLTVTGKATGPIVIVPSATASSATPTTTTPTTTTTAQTWYDAVTCKEATSPTATTQGIVVKKSVSFVVTPRAVWKAAKHGWLLSVKVPTGGIVSAIQPKATTLQAKPASIAPHPLVTVHRVSTAAARLVTLTLKPTTLGQSTLLKTAVLHVKLLVTFDAKDGREGHKTISLTLRR
jgi:hypothetical protein